MKIMCLWCRGAGILRSGKECQECHGIGEIGKPDAPATMGGKESIICPWCRGAGVQGVQGAHGCKECHGTGWIEKPNPPPILAHHPTCDHCHIKGRPPDAEGRIYCPNCGHHIGTVTHVIPAAIANCPGCTELDCHDCNVVLPPAMSSADQCKAFLKDLNTLVDRYRKEFDLTYPQVVGSLHIVAADLCADANHMPEPE